MKLGHRIIRWFCVVSPPAWAVLCAIFFYGIVEGLHQYTLSLNAEPETQMLGKFSHSIVLCMAGLYAMYRGLAFHPAVREDYQSWLALTPWRDPTPLPLGPVQVVTQDLVLLGFFEILLLEAPLDIRLMIPATFFFLLTSCWALLVWTTGLRSAGYEIGFSLGAAVWISTVSQLAAGVCLIATYALALYRMRQTFASFPWAYNSVRKVFLKYRTGLTKEQDKTSELYEHGWPYDLLSIQRADLLPLGDRLQLSGLMGWWAFALLSHTEIEAITLMVIIGSIFGCGMYGVQQVFRYIRGYSPPITLLGRLVTGRWVIPSFDSALLPIVHFVGSLALGIFLIRSEMSWPLRYALPAAVTLFFVLMNVACPDLDKWRLTSQARISPWLHAAGKTEFEQL